MTNTVYKVIERVPLGRPEGSYWIVRGPGEAAWTWHDRDSAEAQAAMLQAGLESMDTLCLLANPAPAEGVRP